MMLEEGHALCLDDLQMGQFLETLRNSVIDPSAGLLSPISLFLVRALMRLYVRHGLDYLLLYQLEQIVCELVQFSHNTVQTLSSHTYTQYFAPLHETDTQTEFPAQKCRTEKKVPARGHFVRDLVHGCRIATDLADTTCTSQLRATPRCDFSRIAAGETIFFVPCVGTTTVVRL